MKTLPITVKLFLIYLVVAVLPLSGLSIWYILSFDNSLRQTELLNIDNIASKKAKQIETYLTQRMLDAGQLHDSSLISESLELFGQAYRTSGFNSVAYRTVEDKLRTEVTRHISNSVYWDLLLIDRDGNVVFSVAQESDLDTNLHTGPYRTTQLADGFDDAIRHNQTFLTKFYPYEPSQNRTAAFITSPVINKKGIILGALALQLNLDRLDSVVGDKTGLGESGTTILAQLDKNQVLFIDSNKQASKNGFLNRIPLSQATYAIQQSLRGDNGKTITKDYTGTEVIAAWRYLPSLDMGMVTKIDTKEALASSIHIHNLSAILFTLILLSSGLIAYWFGRKLTRSITSISNESPRVLWRVKFTREWSPYEQDKQIFP